MKRILSLLGVILLASAASAGLLGGVSFSASLPNGGYRVAYLANSNLDLSIPTGIIATSGMVVNVSLKITDYHGRINGS